MLSKLFVFILLLNSVIFADNLVNICDDKSEWPPYSYYQRVNGKIDKTKLTGAVTELLSKIFKSIGIKYKIDMIPWKRCLYLVEHYSKTNKYEMFINGSYSKKRVEKYDITEPIYYTSKAIFYAIKKFPNGILKDNKFDINRYKLCDVHGYNLDVYYNEYGLDKNKKVDQGARSVYDVLRKAQRGRCDVFIVSLPVVLGAISIGKYSMPKGVKYQKYLGIKPTPFYIYVSKESPRAKELIKKINSAIVALKKNMEYQKIFDKYIK